MSPTVFRYRQYRFLFFSREETRPHVHVSCASGEAKFWIEPEVALAENHGLHERQLHEVARIVTDHREELRHAWHEHFGG